MKNIKTYLKKNGPARYQNLSEKEKQTKDLYHPKRNKNSSEEEKEKKVELLLLINEDKLLFKS